MPRNYEYTAKKFDRDERARYRRPCERFVWSMLMPRCKDNVGWRIETPNRGLAKRIVARMSD